MIVGDCASHRHRNPPFLVRQRYSGRVKNVIKCWRPEMTKTYTLPEHPASSPKVLNTVTSPFRTPLLPYSLTDFQTFFISHSPSYFPTTMHLSHLSSSQITVLFCFLFPFPASPFDPLHFNLSPPQSKSCSLSLPVPTYTSQACIFPISSSTVYPVYTSPPQPRIMNLLST